MQKCRPIALDRTLVLDIGDQGYGGSAANDLFGVEVELEGIKVLCKKPEMMKYWTLHNDGSLRANKPGSECIEYVSNKPQSLADIKAGLKLLFDYLTTNTGTVVFPSYRTSIHIHVNCLNETVRTIVNFITLAIIFDELLVSQNGETRIGNNFCLRSRDAEGQVTDLCNSVSQGSLYNIQAAHRYSSTNFGSLLKFGTIEFRSLECTTDYKRVIDWINLLQGLKEAARQYTDPRDIIAKFSRKGPLGFMVAHLGDQAAKYTSVPGCQNMIRDGMRLAQDFAYCSEWKLPDPNAKQPKTPLSKYEQLVAMQAAEQPAYVPHQWGAAPAGGFLNQAIYGHPDGPQAGAIPMPGPVVHNAVEVADDDFEDDFQIPDDDEDDDDDD